MYKQQTFTKMTEALRQKQIREILDEDLQVNRRVLDSTFRSVRAYDESLKEPSPLEELVSWNIDKQISNLQDAVQNVVDGALNDSNMTIANEDISKIGVAYNLLVSYIQTFAKSHRLNQRDKGALDMKFNELIPLFNQLRQILSNADSYKVVVSAQNLDILNHIEQQIRDSNYKGLSLVNYKRIPVSKGTVVRPANYTGYTPAPIQGRPVSNDDEEESPRSRNQSALRTSDFITRLSDRTGARKDDSPSFFTTPSQDTYTPRFQSPYEAPSTNTPVREEDPEEAIQHVSTFSQQTETPTPKTTTPRKLPTPPPAQKISFKQTKKNGNLEVFINGKPIIGDDGKAVSKEDWNYIYDRHKRNDLSLKTIQGKGNKRGKKHYEPIHESALLYDPDENNLWAD